MLLQLLNNDAKSLLPEETPLEVVRRVLQSGCCDLAWKVLYVWRDVPSYNCRGHGHDESWGAFSGKQVGAILALEFWTMLQEALARLHFGSHDKRSCCLRLPRAGCSVALLRMCPLQLLEIAVTFAPLSGSARTRPVVCP